MIKTPITRMLGIDYPIFQGGMANVSEGTLAAAVSNGGGLGIIASGNNDCEYVKREIRRARSLTDKPFAVNLMLMSPHADEIAELVVEENVKVVTTGAGNPSKYINSWKRAGIRIIPVIASAIQAKTLTRLSVDALIAEGCESGGHIGELTTMVLLPHVLDATHLPVIAAGGIADGRAMAACLVMGCAGVQMGTRFLSAEECRIHPVYKEKIVTATERCTLVTGERSGHRVRSLKSPFSRRYHELEFSGAPDAELEEMGQGALLKAVKDGDEEHGCFLAGQVASSVDRIQSAAEIIREVADEAEEVLGRATGLYGSK